MHCVVLKHFLWVRMCISVEPRLLQLEAGFLLYKVVFCVSSYLLCGPQIFRSDPFSELSQDLVDDRLVVFGELRLLRVLRSYLLKLDAS